MNSFKTLGGFRLFSELKQILNEENPVPAVIRLHEFHLLKVIHPRLDLTPQLITLLDEVKKTITWHDLLFVNDPFEKWFIYILGLFSKQPDDIRKAIIHRFNLPDKYIPLFTHKKNQARETLNQLEYRLPESNFELYTLLKPHKTEFILYMMASATSEKVKKAISHYYTNLKHISITIMGRDLIERGIKPGPQFKDIITDIHKAKLNGFISTRDEELDYIKKYL